MEKSNFILCWMSDISFTQLYGLRYSTDPTLITMKVCFNKSITIWTNAFLLKKCRNLLHSSKFIFSYFFFRISSNYYYWNLSSLFWYWLVSIYHFMFYGWKYKYGKWVKTVGIGHTIPNAPDPIRTLKLSGIRQG